MKDQIKQELLSISKDLNKAQKPIRILDAVKWDAELKDFFFKTKFREIPKAGPEYYAKNPLPYDVNKKIQELEDIKKRVKTSLKGHPVSKILERNIVQYQDVVRMLNARGTKEFYNYSKKLFGSTKDLFFDGQHTVHDLGVMMGEIFSSLQVADLGVCHLQNVKAEVVVKKLNKRLAKYFGAEKVHVKIDDGILSDAAAGSDYIKIRRGAVFRERDIDIFEVHEGWVHVGTTINGLHQTYAKWLAKGPPCTTAIQEGLAFLMEVFTFVCLPERALRINNRLIVCDMAENGANILDVIDYFRSLGQSDAEALSNAQRIFRGAPLGGGAPFTKDLSYCKGFIQVYNAIRSLVRIGKSEMIPFLFAGKLTLEDLPILFSMYEEGLVDRPKYLPKQFADLNGLVVWMGFSNFLNKLKLEHSIAGFKKAHA